MLGSPVVLTAQVNHKDTEIWLTGAALDRMEELGSMDRLEHSFAWSVGPTDEDPLSIRLHVACKCGWKFKRLLQALYLTTRSSVVNELLTEHALFRTDPNHYTYYPAHAR